MISKCESIILSYIKKHGTVSIIDIQSELNISAGGIADLVISLCQNGYLKKSVQDHERYEFTDKIELDSIPDWDDLIQSSLVLFSIPDYSGPYNYNNTPIIKSVKKLNTILKMSDINLNYQYHRFQINNGKKIRTINAPSIKLKSRQRWILRNILSGITIPSYIHGFIKGKSIKTNAESHIGQKEILCLDLKDFFPSIAFESVVNVFLELGYSGAVATRLAQICTCRKVLPQGGVTSPMIANIVALKMDYKLYDFARENDCVYTRYADDLTFSWKKTNIEEKLYPTIQQIILDNGFEINEQKTHVMKSPYRKIVTGLIVTDNSVRVPSRFKKELRKEIYYCQKYGVSSHLQFTGKEHKMNFMEHLYGKAYFIKMVEPEIGESLLRQLDQILQTFS